MIDGKVFKYGDDVSTDMIFPGRYTDGVNDEAEMARYALNDLDPEFVQRVEKGDVIVAGANFGCGASREQAAVCLREAGVGAVVAKSFARIFFRNAISVGLPAVTCPKAADALSADDHVSLDLSSGILSCGEKRYDFPPLPEELLEILDAGGLIPYSMKRLQEKS